MISALVHRETDPEQPVFRRPSNAAIGSIAVAVLALAAVWVYGLVVPGGNKAWRDGDSVIVEKETGTRFVYLAGRLHPVHNYTSALLALGKHAETRSVSSNSLAGVPRGPRIGIPDAPDALPARGKLLTGGWTQCSQPAPDRTGSTVDESVLMVGSEPAGGTELADEALLVEVPDTGDQYLVWHGYRHRIRQPDTVSVGHALKSEPRARVGLAFVDVLPAGQPIAPITVPEVGEPSTAVAGQDIRAGQLLVAETSGGVQHYLAKTDGLLRISEFQYDIQRAFAPTAAAYGGGEATGIRLGLLAAAQAKVEPSAEPAAGDAPPRRPAFAPSGRGAVCATYASGSPVPKLRVDPAMPGADPMTTTPQRTDGGMPLADRVTVPPGRAALVEVMPSAQSPAGTLAIVTDMGRLHVLKNAEVARTLGYDAAVPVRMPAALVARVPQGSPLEPEAALRR
ncbi:type VII secretion protein EccB [Lentzea aerocolonigenes]|uniref:type VII secretion protein EccB n=1 Tax=Lentzea aerocolonigenes TaxID=68170 RepID=UPI001E48B60F